MATPPDVVTDRGLGERDVSDRALDRDVDGSPPPSAPALVRPQPPVSAPIPCRRVSSDLDDLIALLLDAASVGLRLNCDRYTNGETTDLTIDFELTGGAKVVRWSVPGIAATIEGTHRPAVTMDRHDLGVDLPPESSVSPAALDRVRREIRRHLRLFVEVVAVAVPQWGARNIAQLDEMSRWVDSWPREPAVRRFPVVAGEQPSNSFTDATLHDIAEHVGAIRNWLNTPTTCKVPELRVHFQHARPRQLAEAQAVLADPAELDAVLAALADLVDRTLVPLRLTIHGRTDASGTTRGNRDLAVRRAEWVRDRVAHFRFGAVTLRGFGESQASGPVRNPADRRVDLFVTPL